MTLPRLFLCLALAACADSPDVAAVHADAPAAGAPAAGAPGAVLPRGVPTLDATALPTKVDAVVVRCDGDTAAIAVDVVGPADRVEVLLVGVGERPVALAPVPAGPDAVWRRFEATAACDAALERPEALTRVIRAYRQVDGADTLVDCAAVGPAADRFAAGGEGIPGDPPGAATACRAL